jgi:hypothetical protein
VVVLRSMHKMPPLLLNRMRSSLDASVPSSRNRCVMIDGEVGSRRNTNSVSAVKFTPEIAASSGELLYHTEKTTPSGPSKLREPPPLSKARRHPLGGRQAPSRTTKISVIAIPKMPAIATFKTSLGDFKVCNHVFHNDGLSDLERFKVGVLDKPYKRSACLQWSASPVSPVTNVICICKPSIAS